MLSKKLLKFSELSLQLTLTLHFHRWKKQQCATRVFTVQLCLSCIFSRLTNLKLSSISLTRANLVIQFKIGMKFKIFLHQLTTSVSAAGPNSTLCFKMVCWCLTTPKRSTRRSWCHSKMSFVSYRTTPFFFHRSSLASLSQRIFIHFIHS